MSGAAAGGQQHRQHKSKFHPDTIKSIEEVLKRTDDKPIGPEIPVEHNGAPQVEVSEESA